MIYWFALTVIYSFCSTSFINAAVNGNNPAASSASECEDYLTNFRRDFSVEIRNPNDLLLLREAYIEIQNEISTRSPQKKKGFGDSIEFKGKRYVCLSEISSAGNIALSMLTMDGQYTLKKYDMIDSKDYTREKLLLDLYHQHNLPTVQIEEFDDQLLVLKKKFTPHLSETDLQLLAGLSKELQSALREKKSTLFQEVYKIYKLYDGPLGDPDGWEDIYQPGNILYVFEDKTQNLESFPSAKLNLVILDP